MRPRPARSVHSPVHSGDGQQRDPLGAGPLESERAGGRCRTGSHHIVNQKNTPALHQTGPLTLESPRHIAAPSSVAQAGLRRRRFLPPERVNRRNPRPPGNASRQEFGLVESSLPMAPPVKRHGHDRVKAFIAWQSLRQQIPKRFRQGFDASVLVQVDEFAQDALIRTETIGGVETAKASAAQRATAEGIQGKGVQEWRPAADAEEIGAQGLRYFQAPAADGEALDLAQRLAADSALIGEEEGK